MSYTINKEFIYEYELDLPTQELIDYAYYLQNNNLGQYTGENNRSNRTGFQSYEYFYGLNRMHLKESLEPIFKKIQSLVIDSFSSKFQYSLNNYWFNINYPGSYNHIHNHLTPNKPMQGISGTFYLKVPDNSGNIIFTEKKEKVEVISKVGKVLLFSSYLDHEVSENKSNDDRISVAFNYDTQVIKSSRGLL